MRKERGEMKERTVPFYSFLFSRKILFVRMQRDFEVQKIRDHALRIISYSLHIARHSRATKGFGNRYRR